MHTSRKPERTAYTLALAVLLIGLFATFVPPDRDVTAREDWIIKPHWKRCADVVVTGESTVLWSLDPAVLERYVSGLRVVNLGYLEAAFVGSYLADIAEVIDPSSTSPVILVGLNPISLAFNINASPNKQWELGKRISNRTARRIERTWKDELKLRFQVRSVCSFLLGVCPHRYTNKLGRHGFTPTVRRPFDPTYNDPWLSGRARQFSMSKLVPFFEQVRQWRAKGIKVVGLVMPKSAFTRQLMTASNYDESAVIEAFVAAGGILLDAPADGETFDGIHLTPADAAALTRTVGEQLRGIIGQVPPGKRNERCPWPN